MRNDHMPPNFNALRETVNEHLRLVWELLGRSKSEIVSTDGMTVAVVLDMHSLEASHLESLLKNGQPQGLVDAVDALNKASLDYPPPNFPMG